MRSRRRFIVTRAVVRETLPTLGLAAGVTTFMLLINVLFRLAGLMVSRSIPAATALHLLALSLPNIVVLTIPIGMLFAALITSARWSGDSGGLVAIQACGVRPTRIARPLVLVGLLLFAANLVNYWVVVPRTNLALETMKRRLMLSVGLSLLQAKEFVEDFQGYLLYVDRIDPATGAWSGIVLFDINNPLEEQVVLARSGRFTANPIEGSATLALQDATTHLLQPDHPEKYRQNANRSLEIYLRPKGPTPIRGFAWALRQRHLQSCTRVRMRRTRAPRTARRRSTAPTSASPSRPPRSCSCLWRSLWGVETAEVVEGSGSPRRCSS